MVHDLLPTRTQRTLEGGGQTANEAFTRQTAPRRETETLVAALAGCASPECVLPSDRPLRIVCAGDSITRGNSSGKTSRATDQLAATKPSLQSAGDESRVQIGCYPCELASMLPSGTSVRNIGVRGQTAHGLAGELDTLDANMSRTAFAMAAQEALPHADALILMVGTNDAVERAGHLGRYLASVHALVHRMLKIRAGGGRVSARCVWLGIPPAVHEFDRHRLVWRDDNWTALVRDELPRLVRQAAAGLHVGVIDTRAPLEQNWSRAFGLEDPMHPRSDGVHPPPVGMSAIADAVARELRRSINQSRWTECLQYVDVRKCSM